MTTTTFTPDTGLLERYSMGSCHHCAQYRESHHSDGRCYTIPEMAARLEFARRTLRWPGPDEGCFEEEMPHA